jgi:protein-tyrosine phosphatase
VSAGPGAVAPPPAALWRRVALPLLRAHERERALHDWRRRRGGEPDVPAGVRIVAVVCKGNLCRSPFAAALLARARPALRVASYGLEAAAGQAADATARTWARAYGVDLSGHRTRLLDRDAVRAADLVLAMEAWQARAIERRFPFARARVRLLGDYLPAPPFGIEDPWGCDEPVWERSFARIDDAVARLLARLGSV